jgi:aryl-alcohol dehydrogenase-like predicted oxidoreductase
LEGHFTEETTFAPGDHRRHRSREWLIEGVKKVEQVRFLEIEGQRSLGQAALKWLLADPLITSTLPNIYDEAQLEEFAAAPDTPDLTDKEMERCAALYAENFGLTPAEAVS